MRFKIKEPVSTLTHLITCILAVIGTVYLITNARGDAVKAISMAIYGVSLIALYGASSAYHWVKSTERVEKTLKKIDHLAIFALIAGTYTPVFMYGLEGPWRVAMLSTIWGLALAGMVVKFFFINVPRWVSSVIYLSMGWIAIVPFYHLIQVYVTEVIVLMILGGVFYSVGAIVYAKKWFDFIPNKFGFHENFHLWVMAGSIVHFIMIALFILPL
ncbi:hemolysin III family protein [Proteinivorax hydrogeniformans]|uniref:Hemolysin III family protein n=1 Tax=Proteinivorax hydrogeniformans TaxID=1826727 RepID=A0AAU8HW40_9FIRM